MTEPEHSPHSDELLQRYREASADDTRRPGAHVRDAVRAHAQMVIEAGKQAGAPQAVANTDAAQRPAANQSRWKISALAGLALAGLTGLLVLQFDRGTDEEKELAFGQPSATAPSSPSSPASPPAPAPSPSMVPAPAPVAPQTPVTEADAKKRSADIAKPASKSPAPAAQDKAAASPPVTEPVVRQREAEAAPALAAAAPPAAPPPAPAPVAAPAPAAAVQENTQPSIVPRMAGAAAGSLAAPPAQADMAAAAPAARPTPAAPAAAAPAAPAARAVAPQQKQESALQYRAPRAEAGAGPNRLAGALQEAARAGRLELLERLLQQGAPVNAADTAGRTPLILAVMQGHTAVVQRLLAAGANPALVDQEGLNALQHARRLGFDGIAHLIEAAS